MDKDLKLYIWKGVFCDYTCGIAFALAHNEEEARHLIVVEDAQDTLNRWMEWEGRPFGHANNRIVTIEWVLEHEMNRYNSDYNQIARAPDLIVDYPYGTYIYGGG